MLGTSMESLTEVLGCTMLGMLIKSLTVSVRLCHAGHTREVPHCGVLGCAMLGTPAAHRFPAVGTGVILVSLCFCRGFRHNWPKR